MFLTDFNRILFTWSHIVFLGAVLFKTVLTVHMPKTKYVYEDKSRV